MNRQANWEKILTIMLTHKEKPYWTAKDFQTSKYFVGYEATARMSELMKMYPDLFIVGREDRFRTLAIDWSKEDEIDTVKSILGVE